MSLSVAPPVLRLPASYLRRTQKEAPALLRSRAKSNLIATALWHQKRRAAAGRIKWEARLKSCRVAKVFRRSIAVRPPHRVVVKTASRELRSRIYHRVHLAADVACHPGIKNQMLAAVIGTV